jgi:hypothetical protein
MSPPFSGDAFRQLRGAGRFSVATCEHVEGLEKNDLRSDVRTHHRADFNDAVLLGVSIKGAAPQVLPNDLAVPSGRRFIISALSAQIKHPG